MTETSAPQSAPKKKSERSPEKRMTDAVTLAVELSDSDIKYALDASAPHAWCAEEYADKSRQADQIMTKARAIRDFGRAIEGLTPTQLAMVRAGIAASRGK